MIENSDVKLKPEPQKRKTHKKQKGENSIEILDRQFCKTKKRKGLRQKKQNRSREINFGSEK